MLVLGAELSGARCHVLKIELAGDGDAVSIASLGRRCVETALDVARAWPADAICLDAYDTDAGAGDFYRKCGFREVGRVTYKNTPLIYFEWLIGARELR